MRPTAATDVAHSPTTHSPQAASGWATAILATGCTLIAMMQSAIAPLLSFLPTELRTTPGAFAWAVTATMLAGSVFIPIAGRLGDMWGKKVILIGLFVPLLLGSIIVALAPSLIPMVIGRALQGIAMGALPVSLALIRDIVPLTKRAQSIALVGASLGIGGGLALPLSAAVAQFLDWRLFFWAVAVAGAVIMGLIAAFVPRGAGRRYDQRFDGLGAVLLAIGLISLLLGIGQGSVWGWASPWTLGAFALALATLSCWVIWELRTPQPLVNLRTAAKPIVLLTNMTSLFAGMAMYITLITTPQILQLSTATGAGLGLSLLAAGLLMLPGGVIQMLLAPIGARIINAKGPKVALVAGMAVIALGYGSMQPLLASAIGLMFAHMIIKAGVGIAYGAMPALIMGSVSPTEIGSASGFNTVMRTIGSSTGSAVVGAVMGALTVTLGGEFFVSEAGFRVTYLIGFSVAAVAAGVAALIPWKHRPIRSTPVAAAV